MRKCLIPIIFIATTACADGTRIAPEQSAAARAVEALANFEIEGRRDMQRVTAEIIGCQASIDTTTITGDRAGQLDHRDTFQLGDIRFDESDAASPLYVVPLIPGITFETDPLAIMSVGYEAITPGGIARTVPVWKNPREPFTQGPVINGVDYVIGPRNRGSFFVSTSSQVEPVNTFVAALVDYGARYCSGGLS